MSYDPNVPLPNAAATSAMFRAQFQGLKSLIDAVPTISSAVVDAVTPLPPGEAPTVSASITAGVLHLSFGLPQGVAGQVTEQTLAKALNAVAASSSANTNAVDTLHISPLPYYEESQFIEVVSKLNELILAMRRA